MHIAMAYEHTNERYKMSCTKHDCLFCSSLMIMAMKVSFTAFSLDDGQKPVDKLTPNQLKYKIP